MSKFFRPNIEGAGRWIRSISGLVSLGAAAYVASVGPLWLAIVLAGSGAFMLYEGLRGWCLMRACGVRTKW